MTSQIDLSQKTRTYISARSIHFFSERVPFAYWCFRKSLCVNTSLFVLSSGGKNETQKFFSTLFRNMNYLGLKLSPLESRRSLYYLNAELEKYFDGEGVAGNYRENAILLRAFLSIGIRQRYHF